MILIGCTFDFRFVRIERKRNYNQERCDRYSNNNSHQIENNQGSMLNGLIILVSLFRFIQDC